MYIVTCNTAHKDTITLFGTFKTMFGAKAFIKKYKENVEAYKADPIVAKFQTLKKEIASEDFKKKLAMFPQDRVLASKLFEETKLTKSVKHLAKLYGLELIDDLGNPFEFKIDYTDYIFKISYPINISVSEEPNWRRK